MHRRLIRERKTVDIMIELYCNEKHGGGTELCPDCLAVKDYANLRLEKCPYQEKKTTCTNCPTHCYQKSMRDQIREIMRYSGPRMLKKNPWLAIFHLLDGFRKPVHLKKKKG